MDIRTLSYKSIPILFCIYMFAILFYRVMPITLTVPIGFAIVLVLLIIFMSKINTRRLFLLIFLFFSLIVTTIVTKDISTNISDYVRVATYFLIVCLISEKEELQKLSTAFKDGRKLLFFCSFLASIITLIGLFTPMCYQTEDTWGGARYYLGFGETFHVNASCMCLCIAMFLYSRGKTQFRIIELFPVVVFLLGILQSGARVYLICALTILIIYYIERISKKQIKYLLVPTTLVVGITYLLNSNMMDKFLYTKDNSYLSSSTSELNSLTSGRIGFWTKGLEGFKESDLFEKLFGHGFDYIRVLTGHSGHNDLIHMLLGIGLLGVFFYVTYMLMSIYRTSKNIKNSSKSSFLKLVYIISFIVYIVGPMVLNGLFGYQHLLFSIVILSIFIFEQSDKGDTYGLS